MKNILRIIKRYETICCSICQVMLCALILLRLAMAYRTALFTDTRFFVETANWVRQGLCPYKPEVFLTKFGAAPLQSPSMSLLSMPLCFCSITFQNIVLFILGTLAYFAFAILVFNYFGFNYKEYIKPRWRSLPVLFVLTLVCIASPFLGMLRAGQNSSLAAVCLFIAILYPANDKISNIVWLGLSAAFKYSVMTFQIPILVLQRRLKMSVLAFILFVVLCLSIGIWLDDLVTVFHEYVECVTKSTSHGGNSYGEGSFFFLSIGFLKSNMINRILRIFICLAYAGVLLKIWKRNKAQGEKSFPMHLTAVDWGLFTFMTIFFSYHRIQDGVLFMPFLGVIVLELYQSCIKKKESNYKQSVFQLLLAVLFLLFWTIPSSIIFSIGSKIGNMIPAAEKIVYYPSDEVGGFSNIFPIMPFVMLAIIVYLLWLEFSFEKADTYKC